MQYIGLLTSQQKQAGYFVTQDEEFVWLFHRHNGKPVCIANWLYDGLTIQVVRNKAQEHMGGKVKRTPLKRRTPLRAKRGFNRHRGLNRISPKQRELNRLWAKVTDERAKEERHICQWCHRAGQRLFRKLLSYLDGHHIIKRSHGRIDTKENCYICHRFGCHREIDDNNVDVRQFPDREAWLKSKEQKEPGI